MAALASVPRYTQHDLYLPRWDLHVPAARDREGTALYFPIVCFCDLLGIDKRKQVAVLRRDTRYSAPDVLREVPFRLSGVWRTPLSIRKPECGLWLAGIDPQRCKPEMRGRIMDFQADLMAEADRLLFGAAPRVPALERSRTEYHQQERIRIACQDCGAPHTIVIENGAVLVIRDREGSGEE